ncbi:hypothetical protein [Dysgonomonas sp. 520]|nr:hypothetical protein [Dysgonomonas sp. 520]
MIIINSDRTAKKRVEKGIEKIDNTTFVNASMLNEQYELANKPVLLEI